MPGPLKILLILVLFVLLFGAGRVPLVMENLAKGIRSFKKGLSDDDGVAERKAVEDKKSDV